MEIEEKKRENLIAGTVGAFLGSLTGAVCIVALGQLGYVAAISGLVMAVCALKGLPPAIHRQQALSAA